jgi:hypothetical protein
LTKRLNKALDINIGARVWLALNAVILRGANISSGSIVGLNSLIKNKTFPNNCIIAGTPARIIKKDIFWTRHNLVVHSEKIVENSKYDVDESFIMKTDMTMPINFGKGFERVINKFNFYYNNRKIQI